MIISVDAEQLAAAVFPEGQRHLERSPQRRAAAHAWVGLITSPGITAARHAVRTFGIEETQTAALEVHAERSGEDPAGRANETGYHPEMLPGGRWQYSSGPSTTDAGSRMPTARVSIRSAAR